MTRRAPARILTLALALTLALSAPFAAPASAAASDMLTVRFTVATYQNRARAALKQVNALRKQSGAGELVMTAALETAAVQRAAELFVRFDHDRPNLQSYETAVSEGADTRTACAESVAAGYSSADKVMADWGESALDNLLDPDFTHAGIACVYVKGSYNEYYWALYLERQPEGFKGRAAAATAKSGAQRSVSVDIAKSALTRADDSHSGFALRASDIHMKTKQTAEPTVYLYDKKDVKIGKCELSDLSYKSSNTAVFTVKQSGTLRRKKAGTGTLTVSFGSLKTQCAVTIGSASVSSGAAVTAATIGDSKPELVATAYKEHTTLAVYVKGASGYVLYRCASKNGSYTKADEKATTKRWTLKLAHEDMQKAYYYKVRAYKNQSGRRVYSEYSAPVRVAP